MKGILEYIKLIPTVLQNADKIVEGIINDTKLKHGHLPQDEQEEIVRRRVICAGCPFMSENAVKEGNYSSSRAEKHCIHCNCEIDWKTASLTSRCGISVYNSRHRSNPLPLKWDVYDKTKKNEQ